MPTVRLLLLLLAACALCVTPARMRAAEYFPSLFWDEPAPLGILPIGNSVAVPVFSFDSFYTNGPANDLSFSHIWAGGESDGAVGYPNYTYGLWFTPETAGTFDLSVTLVASHIFGMGTNSITRSFHVLAVTNVTASTNHIAMGTNVVTFTAQMMPVVAGEHIFWNVPMGGVSLSTNQGMTTTMVCDTPGEFEIMAICGSSFVTTTITVYSVSGVTASSNLVAAGESITFTATTTPENCPLPLTWTGSTGTGLSTTSAFAAGNHSITVSLGTSTQSVVITTVGVKDIQYEGKDGGTLYVFKGDTFEFTALPEPAGASWPVGWPKWAVGGGAAGGAGETSKSQTFGSVSASSSGYKVITAICGNSSNSVNTITFDVSLTSAPDDNFSGRSLSEFGLGEVIYFTNTIAPGGISFDSLNLEWRTNFPSPADFSTAAGGGYAAAASGGTSSALAAALPPSAAASPSPASTATFSGAYDPGTYEVGVGRRNRPNAIVTQTFQLVAPTGFAYLFLTAPVATSLPGLTGSGTLSVGPNTVHLSNTVSAFQGFNIWLKPANVSWAWIEFAEDSTLIYHTGVLADRGPVTLHTRWVSGVDRGIAGLGCRVSKVDVSGFSLPVLPSEPPLSSVGTSTVDIPLQYGRATQFGSTNTTTWLPLGVVRSAKRVELNGDATGVKDGQSYGAKFNDPTQVYP